MQKILFLAIVPFLGAVGCKTLQSDSEVKTDVRGVKQIQAGEPPCYGDRKFTATDHRGFDFNATNSHLGNAYWLSLAAASVYGTGQLNKELFTDLGQNTLKSFQFYGEAPDDKGAKGYLAEFDQGVIIAYRGTNEARDLLTNIDRARFRGKAYNRDGKLEDLQIHRGFWRAAETTWDPIVKTILNNAPLSTLDVTSAEAFLQANRVFRSIMQEADIESYQPNDLYKAEIKNLQDRGIIKADANLSELLGVLNIWAEEAKLASTAYAASALSGDSKSYTDVVASGMARKKRNFPRVHPFFNYRSYKPIWITGHSLGGALSTVLAYRLMKYGIPVQGLVTFGSPRNGNDVYEYFFESSWIEEGRILNLMRFQNDNDGVTRIPHINGWRHVGDPWFISQDKKLLVPMPPAEQKIALETQMKQYPAAKDMTYYPGELPPGYKGIWTFDLLEFVGDHAMGSQYITHIENFVFGKRATGCN